MTNGKYQNIEHRVTVNPHKERMSISAFHLPKFDMSVGPLSEIVGAELKKYKTLRVDEVAMPCLASESTRAETWRRNFNTRGCYNKVYRPETFALLHFGHG